LKDIKPYEILLREEAFLVNMRRRSNVSRKPGEPILVHEKKEERGS
jgi:hypothetical protein